MVIGISGKFCSGKDSAAEVLIKNGFTHLSFATKLKEIASDLFGMKEKDRTLLQELGKKMRDIRPDVWVEYALRQVEPGKDYVFTDVRYANELARLKRIGAVLVRCECAEAVRTLRFKALYHREPTVSELYHASETELDKLLPLFDHVLHTDTLNKAEAQDALLEIWNKNKGIQ